METSIIDRFNKWLQESVTVKLVSIGFLVLLLLIPSTWIQHLMHERQSRAEDVIDEISSKWSGKQSLSGPVLVIPYHYRETVIDRNKEGVEYVERKANYYFLPEKLDVKGTVKPQVQCSVVNMEPMNDGTFDQCQQHRIIPMAWSPLGGGNLFSGSEEEQTKRDLS